MLTLNDGRSELWQWDTGRTLAVDADCSQVHFSNKVFGRSIDVDVVDGAAIIPDILLQTDKDLNVWAFVGAAENGYTKISKTFKVNRRNKPADYVFTPTEQMTLQMIQRQIGDLADLTTEAKETLVSAINEALTKGGGTVDEATVQRIVDDYLAANPPSVTETDPTVPAWAKQPEKPSYTAAEVGALSVETLPEAINTALAQAKASGEFDGADGQPGENGADGFSPTANVTQNDNGATITIADKNGTTTATVTNGKDGADGNPGADGSPGKDGADGKSAYQYAQDGGYTGTEEEFAAKLAQEKFANPNALTFTGAVTGSYDGSEAVTVEIPSGGGGSGGSGGMSQLGMVTLTEPAASIVLNFTAVEDIIISAQFTGGLDEQTSTTIKLLENYDISSGAGYNHNVTVKLSSSAVGYYMGYLYSRSLRMRGVLYAQTNINIAGNTTALRYRNIEDKIISSVRVFTDSATPFGAGTTITVYGGKL